MLEELTVFEVMRMALLWLSPIFFLVGMFLLFTKEEKHHKLESVLGKEMGILNKKLIPRIENNIDIFHKWLIRKRAMLGLFLIVYSTALFIVLRK